MSRSTTGFSQIKKQTEERQRYFSTYTAASSHQRTRFDDSYQYLLARVPSEKYIRYIAVGSPYSASLIVHIAGIAPAKRGTTRFLFAINVIGSTACSMCAGVRCTAGIVVE